VTDGDADRLGASTNTAISSTHTRFFSILLRWLLERKGWTGGVTRAFNTTKCWTHRR